MKRFADLKIEVSSHGSHKATLYVRLKEGTLADYEIETREVELTVSLVGIGEMKE